jgi:hypothetical protein
MLVTLSGMLTLVRPLQSEKAQSPMLVTLSGMVKAPVLPPRHRIKTVLSLLYNTPPLELYSVLFKPTFIAVRLLQPRKALLLILVTLSGMLTLVRLLQPEKA